jgi:hypothetical protein
LSRSEYAYDNRFIGDFEARRWTEFGGQAEAEYHEIWIPIVRREGSDQELA